MGKLDYYWNSRGCVLSKNNCFLELTNDELIELANQVIALSQQAKPAQQTPAVEVPEASEDVDEELSLQEEVLEDLEGPKKKGKR